MRTSPVQSAVTIVVVGLSAGVASAQPQPPVDRLPPGFKVVTKNVGQASVSMEALKPNTARPRISVDADIHLGFAWQANPAAEQIISILAATPEDARSVQGGVTNEPAGRTRLRGGVLTLTKCTIIQVGTSAPPWVVYSGAWVAAAGGGLLSIGVSNYAGSKEEIQPLIEALIPPGLPTR